MNKDFREHFYYFTNKIKTGDNFAFARYSDGELLILKNIKLVLDQNLIQVGENRSGGPYQQEDFKCFDPDQHFVFQQKLVEAFKHKQHNYFKGISCSCCVGKPDFDWQIELHEGDDDSLSWANLWVNGNYPLFITETVPLFSQRKCVFVGHHNADVRNLPYIIKEFRVGYNAMINNYGTIFDIKNWIVENDIRDHLFLFSASTFSNFAIYELFEDFPNNTYIDIGTCLAPYIRMPTQRAYLRAYWYNEYHQDINKICIWN